MEWIFPFTLNKILRGIFVNVFALLDIQTFQEITLCNQNRHFCICIHPIDANTGIQLR